MAKEKAKVGKDTKAKDLPMQQTPIINIGTRMLRTLSNLFPRARKARKPAEMAMAMTPRLFLRSTPRQWKVGILLSWTTGKMNIEFVTEIKCDATIT